MVACVLSQNLAELPLKLNKAGVHVGTLHFLEQIIRTGESQQSHHPLWLSVHVTEKLCDQCPCVLLVKWNKLLWQYLARNVPHGNKHKFVTGSGCFLSKQSHRGETSYMHTHPMNWISVRSSCLCQLIATIFICPTLENIHQPQAHEKLSYIPAMQYTLSICTSVPHWFSLYRKYAWNVNNFMATLLKNCRM
jgi:hypothetical protein